jgi:hypothetical protein
MDNAEIKSLLEVAADPKLVTSAEKASELLMKLQPLLTHLRLEVSELELKADLSLNEMLKTDIAIERGKAEWRVSDIYKEWKQKAGILQDVRAVKRNLERHYEILINQEKRKPYGYERAI